MQVCSDADEPCAVAPPVVLERDIDIKLDNRGRGDLHVLDGRAGQVPEPAGRITGAQGWSPTAGVSMAAIALQSPQQRQLTGYFPEIVAALEELDVEVVLDGELVLWAEGRIDFAALQRRLYPDASPPRPAGNG